ncbi:hypothetical protein Vadar_031074 [Vaccinium darrowii]|uniref:Uncharacterized protein n=1 Tax=Vaccinium darrowii TaxID=229202 RepID=A0ACB7YH24_9ERIC|nr:hypothetical protein Vadar_031074 [Vaccinium darrowii]
MEWSNIFEPVPFPSQFGVEDHNKHPVDWTFEENKVFENALAEFGLDSPAFFDHVAFKVPSKSMDQIKRHYACLLQDLEMIEAGLSPMPRYETPHHHDHHVDDNQGGGEDTKGEKVGSSSKQVVKKTSNGNQRKKGVPWTEEEHQLFLMGLNKYGKGDWRSISRHYVVTKTPTQVASHAQKFYRRQTTTTPADRRRPSIHDIQTVNSTFFPYPPEMNIDPIINNEAIPPQVPISTPYGPTPMNNNFNSHEGLMTTNFGTDIGPSFHLGNSTFPISNFATNQTLSANPSASNPIPYPRNNP